MKTLLVILATLTAANVASAANSRYDYTCGKLKDVHISVINKGSKTVIFQSFPSEKENGVINIYSEPTTPTEVNDNEAGIRPYISFAGFHYPNGTMYIAAEGDTNEEGYTLNVQPKMLEGAARVTLSEVYWSDFHGDAKPTKFTCVRD